MEPLPRSQTQTIISPVLLVPSVPKSGIAKKLLYISTFLLFTPITLFTTLYALHATSRPVTPLVQNQIVNIQTPHSSPRVYAAIPDPVGQVAGAATAGDARTEIIKQYLQRYESPLVPYSELIIQTAEKYGLDFRLLVAIAQQESNLCKKIPPESHNCWGWGIHSKGTLMFDDYETAIDTVSKGLKEKYIDKGYMTPEEIMSKYTPSSPGTWAAGVNQFLGDME
jgi:hypothetical protein